MTPCTSARRFYSFGESGKHSNQQRLTLLKQVFGRVRTSRALDDKYAMGAVPIPVPVASTELTSTHDYTCPTRPWKLKNGLTVESNTDLPSFPLALPARDITVDRYGHRRTILKGDVGNCVDAGLEVGYVPNMPSQEVLRVCERGKGSVESWLWGGTAVEYQRARDMGMKQALERGVPLW
jgi:hypothetical protein